MRSSLRHLAFLFALLVPALASADGPDVGGVNLRWDSCHGDGGAQNRNFACDTNSGVDVLVGSIATTSNITNVSGLTFAVELASASAGLPAWWGFKNVGTCRQISLTMSVALPPGAANCLDWTNGLSSSGIGVYQVGIHGANTARIVAVSAVPNGSATTFVAGQEYLAFRYQINHAKTVGTGSCAGCSTPVCLRFLNAVLARYPDEDLWTYGPTNQTDSDYATWQGGGVPVTPGGSGCPAATPTRKRTWGAVKSLYR